MIIASRTPEGEPAQCPVCGEIVLAEPSVFFSDAPCPSCGTLLWFVRLGQQNLLVQPTEKAKLKGLLNILSDLTGISESELENNSESLDLAELDSLDLVELIVSLEDESGAI